MNSGWVKMSGNLVEIIMLSKQPVLPVDAEAVKEEVTLLLKSFYDSSEYIIEKGDSCLDEQKDMDKIRKNCPRCFLECQKDECPDWNEPCGMKKEQEEKTVIKNIDVKGAKVTTHEKFCSSDCNKITLEARETILTCTNCGKTFQTVLAAFFHLEEGRKEKELPPFKKGDGIEYLSEANHNKEQEKKKLPEIVKPIRETRGHQFDGVNSKILDFLYENSTLQDVIKQVKFIASAIVKAEDKIDEVVFAQEKIINYLKRRK